MQKDIEVGDYLLAMQAVPRSREEGGTLARRRPKDTRSACA